MTEKMYTIIAPHFTCGAIIRDGVCVWEAPIISYMRDWPAARIDAYCKKKNWKFEVKTYEL